MADCKKCKSEVQNEDHLTEDGLCIDCVYAIIQCS